MSTFLQFSLTAAQLSNATEIELVSPVNGLISKLWLTVQTDIVTGGDVSVKLGNAGTVLLTATVADGLTKGSGANDVTPATGNSVVIGGRIRISPTTAFNGGGALNGFVQID